MFYNSASFLTFKHGTYTFIVIFIYITAMSQHLQIIFSQFLWESDIFTPNSYTTICKYKFGSAQQAQNFYRT